MSERIVARRVSARHSSSVTAAIIEKDPLVANAMSEVISNLDGITNVLHFGTINACRDAILNTPIDLVILDPSTLGDLAVDASEILDNPALSTLLYTSMDQSRLALALVRNSVIGFARKIEGLSSLRRAVVRALLRLQRPFPVANSTERPEPVSLSLRERQTLQAIGRGFTLKETAGRLGISLKSVETYKARACSKLGILSRSELVGFVAYGERVQRLCPADFELS